MLIIRDAGAEDRDALDRMMAALNRIEHEWRPDRDLDPEATGAHMRYLEGLAADGGFVMVGDVDGAAAAFLVGLAEVEEGAYIEPCKRRYGLVSDLYVEPAFRRSGLGRALLREAVARFRAAGMSSVRVHALAENTGAAAAYTAFGFSPYETAFRLNLD